MVGLDARTVGSLFMIVVGAGACASSAGPSDGRAAVAVAGQSGATSSAPAAAGRAGSVASASAGTFGSLPGSAGAIGSGVPGSAGTFGSVAGSAGTFGGGRAGGAGRSSSGAGAPAAGMSGRAAIAGAGGSGSAGHGADPASGTRGFPSAGPWVSWYGESGGAATVSKVAMTFRVINIDADPEGGNLSDAELQTLRANGQNRVLSYLNLGSCEMSRSYYSSDPAGHKSCKSSGGLTTAYDGYPDEMWANLSNPDYQDLMVNYVAARLVERGVDGFYLDNLEVVEHGANNRNGPCDSQCSQGGLDLVWQLRQKFPDKLIVMQNASSDVTRRGMTHGMAFPALLDGVSHEEVYSNGGDSDALDEMLAWRDMQLTVNGHPFWLAVEEYVGACSSAKKADADMIAAKAKADGLSAYVTDESGSQNAPCFW
jgi:cysteinyl-tRNA synthetase